MRNNTPITAHGQTKTAAQWAAEARARGDRLTVQHIGSRIELFGWSPERAVTAPIDERMAEKTRQRFVAAKIRRSVASRHGLCNVPNCIRRAAPGSGFCVRCIRKAQGERKAEAYNRTQGNRPPCAADGPRYSIKPGETPRPDWMQDRRLLPKAPPGAKGTR